RGLASFHPWPHRRQPRGRPCAFVLPRPLPAAERSQFALRSADCNRAASRRRVVGLMALGLQTFAQFADCRRLPPAELMKESAAAKRLFFASRIPPSLCDSAID